MPTQNRSSRTRWIFLFLVVQIATAFSSFAQDEPIVISDPDTPIKVGGSIRYIGANNRPFSEILELDETAFQSVSDVVPNLNLLSTESDFWIRFKVRNESEQEELILELRQPIMDGVSFYEVKPDGTVAETLLPPGHQFEDRKYPYRDYLFDLKIPQGSTNQYFMRLQSGNQVQVPMRIGTFEAISDPIINKNLFFGTYFGIMLIMLFYNLFIWFSTRDRSYIYYVVYITIVALTQASLQGFTFQYLLPDLPWLANQSVFFFSALIGIAAAEFQISFLQLKSLFPRFIRMYWIFYVAYLAGIVLAAIGFTNLSWLAVEFTALGLAIFMIFVAVKAMNNGSRPAKFFLLAWSIFLVGVMIYVWKDFGILPYNDFTAYTMLTGSAIEALLLSFGLADRINTLKREKQLADQKALATLRENERIIREQNVLLEQKVTERTTELEAANKDLGVALDNLKETQAQLVQAEKMSSLGQLTAGIAHEINNSINFVTACTKPLKRDVDDIMTILNKYDELTADSLPPEQREIINQLKRELEMDILVEEIDNSIHAIDEGAHRTLEIAAGLKTFSRLDEDGWAQSDLNAGIESTVRLVKSSLAAPIELTTEFGTLPLIECQQGKLNQVFMNIIGNGLAAVQEQHPEGGGTIAIKTWGEDGNAFVSIKDNGIGMSPETRDKIFDPFFTTKDVGQGTGLGLSIAHGIIQNHKGSFTVVSEPGQGSEFIIQLPIA